MRDTVGREESLVIAYLESSCFHVRHLIVEDCLDLLVVNLRLANKHILCFRDVLQAWHMTDLPLSLSVDHDLRGRLPDIELSFKSSSYPLLT